ncbi:MAG: CinA family protein, partial [Desulfohalobiaceae bacterium]
MEKADRLLVQRIGHSLKDKGWTLSSAESCTGGLAAHILTNVSGSSEWFVGGVVAYADRIKQDLLGVDERILRDTGAVSRETVEAMARGVVGRFHTQAGLAVSGIAG